MHIETKQLRALWCLSFAGTPCLFAQGASIPVLDSLRPGTIVRVTSGPEAGQTGRVLSIGEGRLGLSTRSGAIRTIPVGQITMLELRGRQTRVGAVIGGMTGVAAGLFFGWIINAVCETDDCRGARPFLITIPVFAAGGGFVGGVIGTAFPKWTRVYP